jgi:hypothetical protein
LIPNVAFAQIIATNKSYNASEKTNSGDEDSCLSFSEAIEHNLDLILIIIIFQFISFIAGQVFFNWYSKTHRYNVRERAKRIKKIRNNRIEWNKRFGNIESKQLTAMFLSRRPTLQCSFEKQSQ